MIRYIMNEIKKRNSVVVAVSGGVDSMFLLNLCKSSGAKIHVAHLNHNIRDSSINDQKFVEEYCENQNFNFHTKTLKTPEKNEAYLREKRYEFLSDICIETKANCVLTGHHYDDNIENIIMRFFRGCDTENLGIKRNLSINNVEFFRPLLDIKKDYIINTCIKRNIPWIEDPTNLFCDYERNLFRNVIIPEIKKVRNINKTLSRYVK